MRLAFTLGTLASLQFVVGLALQLAVFALLGAGEQTDAWVAAQAVPFVLATISAVSFQGAWQGRFAVVGERQDEWIAAQRVAQGQVLMLTGSIAAGLVATASLWVPLLFPGLSLKQWSLTTSMTCILLPACVLNAQSALFASALRGRDGFVIAEVVILIGALIGIALTVALLDRYGVVAAAWAQLARSVLVFVASYLIGGRPTPSLRGALRDRTGWRLSAPILIGSTFYKTGPIVDRYWTSLAPAGGMTTFNLMQLGMGAVASVLERALCVPAIPSLARLADTSDHAGMRKLYRQRLVRVGIAVGIVLLTLLAVRPWWGSLVGSLLRIDADAAASTWWLCIVLVGYLYPAAAGSIVVSSFQALHDTLTPVRIGTIGFALSLLLKAAGFLSAGLPGLAAAIAVHYMGNMVVMTWLLERRLNREGSRCSNRLPK